MTITIKKNQKIQNLQIIDYIYMCMCVCVITQIQILKLPKYQKVIQLKNKLLKQFKKKKI